MTAADSDRNPVEALADEYVRRLRRGETPSPTEYAAQFPEMADEIAELFPMMQALEQAKAPPPAKRPERLGDYRILREIGRGGMGVVYEAEQDSLGRRVAIKVLPHASQASPNRILRFRREAHAAARLHHSHIVPVYGFGEQDGLCYYVMPLIDGRALDELPRGGERRKTPDWHWIARLGRQAAEALDYAHGKGILHRDIKPANLLLDADGRLWVTDFGLAKPTDGPDLTAKGDLLGTLRYMAPERFEGRADARSDIWSLGLTLFELAAGRPAFDARDRLVLGEQIRRAGPPPLRNFAPQVPADLEAVITKAATCDPAQRYPSAGAMAEDLRRFLDDLPVSARRPGFAEGAGRFCRRNRSAAISIGVAAAVAAAAVLVLAIVTLR